MFEDGNLFEDEEEMEIEEYVEVFLEAWAEQNFENAYDMLTQDSPLRGGLSRKEWVAQRETWVKQAHPNDVRYETFFDYNEEPEEDENSAEATETAPHDDVEVFWSMEVTATPLDSTIKELPKATITYPDTKRQWYWTTFTLVEQGDEFLIHNIIDEGAMAELIPATELQQDIERAAEDIQDIALALGVEEANSEMPVDLEDELESVSQTVLRALHYSDALIAQSPQDTTPYELATSLATITQEWERAAAYIELLAERFPEQRGDALSSLAVILSHLVGQYEQEGEADRAEHISKLIEQKLRDAIATTNNFTAYILLADYLIDEGERLEEVEPLLAEAQKLAKQPQEEAQVENSLGRLAEARNDLKTALSHFQRAAELDPELPDIWINLGDTYGKLHQLDDAERSYLRAIEANPAQSYPYVELASIYTSRGEFPKAYAILDQGMETSPSADLLASRAIVYTYAGDLRSAEQYLQSAEEVDPDLELVQRARELLETRKKQNKQNKPKSNKSNKQNKPKKR